MLNSTLKKTAYSLFFIVIFLVTTVYFLLNSEVFQNWVTRRVTDYLSAKFKTTITIGHITYHPFTNFDLENIYWGDQKNDTLFYVEKLKFNFVRFQTDSMKLVLKDVKLNGAYCKIITYPDKTFNIDILTDLIDTINKTPSKNPFKLFINNVIASDSRFRYIDSTRIFDSSYFDGFNQDFSRVNFQVKNFTLISDSLNLEMKNLACTEKCGIELKKLSGKVIISPTLIGVENLDLTTAYSHITKKYQMRYNGWDELIDFNNKTKLVAEMTDSKIDLRDLAFFIPYFKNKRQLFSVNFKTSGALGNFKINDAKILFGSNSKIVGNIRFKGLPDINETYIELKADEVVTNSHDLEFIVGKNIAQNISKLGNVKFSGHYTGFFNDFVAAGKFNTDIGDVNSDLNIKFGDSTSTTDYSGDLHLLGFNLGKLINNEKLLGKTTLSISIAGKDFDIKKHKSKFSSTADYFFLNGYNFQNIKAEGKIDKQIFEGKLDLNDPHGKFSFNGLVDLHSEMKKLKFTASLKKADLQAMNLLKSKKIISADLDFDFAYKNLDNNNGTISASNIVVEIDSAKHYLNKLTIVSKVDNDNEHIRIKSEMFNAELKGDLAIGSFSDNINNILHSVLPNYFSKIKTKDDEEFSYKINISNSEWLSNVFYPDLRFYDLSLEGKVSSSANEIIFNGIVPSLYYKNFSVRNLGIKSKIENGESGRILLGMDNLYYNDSAVMKDFIMNTKISKNELSNLIKIIDTTGMLHADILTDLKFYPGWMNLSFQGSEVTFRRRHFRIDEKSVITYSDTALKLKEIKISDGENNISLNGADNFKDMYNVKADLKDFDVGLVNIIFPRIRATFGGSLNGSVVLKGNDKKNMVNANLRLQNFSLDSDTLGEFEISSEYNESQQRVLVYTKSLNGKLKNFEGGGYFSTSGDKEISLNLLLNESDVNFLQAFMRDEVHFYSGTVSAKCSLAGTFDNPRFDGKIDLNKMDIGIKFLKTRFRFDSHFEFDNETIHIPKFTFTDDRGQDAIVSGKIFHKSFSNYNLDIKVDKMNHFHVMNTTVKDNEIFYGNAYASGSVDFSGGFDNIMITANLTTERGTIVYIPLAGSSNSGENGIINFVDRDTSTRMFVKQPTSVSGFELNCTINATQDAEFQLIMNEQTGDVIKAKGNGTVRLELTRQGNFSMYGQVVIDEGEYRFTAANIFTKKFILVKGGTLSWTGNPMLAHMDIQGLYNVRKASISELVTSKASGSDLDTKIQVECLLYVKGNLSAPEIKFDLNFPDLQTTIGSNNVSEIQSALRTLRNEPDMMNQQVMSLMLFGKFVPMSSYNSASNTNLSGYSSTLSDIISSQANALIGNIIPGLDFNIDYQTANDVTKGRTIVSASKKFYNNRLEVQTSYDPQYANNANITTQYNLTKDGNLKIKAFNKNYTDPIYRNYSITQGVGLYYRKEFDSLFKKKSE